MSANTDREKVATLKHLLDQATVLMDNIAEATTQIEDWSNVTHEEGVHMRSSALHVFSESEILLRIF